MAQPHLTVPDWMLDNVVYQIFPDRFAIGNGRSSSEKLSAAAYAGATHRDWSDAPLEPGRGNDFFGGDLDGIREHLDHIARLGAGTIYLNPIFPSPSNHKYDTVDFFRVDEQLGGDAAFDRLVEAVHARGMRLVLDVSLNHVSDRHPWFEAGRRGEPPYHAWFGFGHAQGYRCWRDHGHMPELDLSRDDVREVLFAGRDSVIGHWLARGIDGWRLDVSPDLGMSVSAAIRETMGARFPQAALIGEVWAWPGDWVGRGGYHGVMSYFFRDSVVGWLRGQLHARQVGAALEEAWREHGPTGMLTSWNMLSSHDTARLKNVLPDEWRRWLALVAQFTLPGVPHVYYGEEIGLTGGPDPGCRGPMPWAPEARDEGLLSAYAWLIALRRGHRALSRGALRVLSQTLDQDVLVYLRHTDVPGEVALVALNPLAQRVRRRVLVAYSHLYDALPLTDALGAAPPLRMDAGSVEIDLPPHCAAVWVPDDTTHARYSFFKPQ